MTATLVDKGDSFEANIVDTELEPAEINRIPIPATFVTADTGYEVDLILEVVVAKKADRLVEYLRLVNPRVHQITAADNIAYVDIGLERMLPLNMFGRGMVRAAQLLAVCIAENHRILLSRILRWRIVGRPEGDYDRRLWRLGAGGGVFGAGPGLGGGPAGLGRGPERLAETRGVGAAARRLRKAGVRTGQAGAGGGRPRSMARSARRGRPRAGSARANPSEVRRAREVILAGAAGAAGCRAAARRASGRRGRGSSRAGCGRRLGTMLEDIATLRIRQHDRPAGANCLVLSSPRTLATIRT